MTHRSKSSATMQRTRLCKEPEYKKVNMESGSFAGGVLGNVAASTDWESRIDAGFDYLKEWKKRKEYIND